MQCRKESSYLLERKAPKTILLALGHKTGMPQSSDKGREEENKIEAVGRSLLWPLAHQMQAGRLA